MHLARVDPELARLLDAELGRQNATVELIASENFVPEVILEVQGSILTNKYAEGYPGRRYHGGCQFIDEIESLAIARAKQLFGAEHANVQPHSGVNANLAVYVAVLEPGDTIMGMDLAHGGHLSHGAPVSASGKFYRAVSYGVDPDTELIDYDAVARLAERYRPRLIIAGASAYSRLIDWARFRQIADAVGAYFMVDMAHIAGLVAGRAIPSPVPHADFVTSTTTKTMRGARGGIILCRSQYGPQIDKAIFPGIQGGPILQNVAAKAVTFRLAMTDAFQQYAQRVVDNARTLASALSARGFRIVSGGTDTHLMLVDLRGKGITGARAEEALEEVAIAVNKNLIPYDPARPGVCSGIRLGTAAVTSRGFDRGDMEILAEIIADVLEQPDSETVRKNARARVKKLCLAHPLYLDRFESAASQLEAGR
ncbi:MAG: serine hydroxymethyltransferase [Bacillota bacterium]|nr:serine hydroxymethyltransferase [Bacillota bacterium]